MTLNYDEMSLKTDLFDYPLPEHLIAHAPTTERDHSRLLVVDRKAGTFSDHWFYDLPHFLAPSDRLVVNTTKVIPSRLHLTRKTGGKIEALLISPSPTDPTQWVAMVRSAKKLHPNESLFLPNSSSIIFIGPADSPGLFHVKFLAGSDPKAILSEFGEMPLPPYIHPSDSNGLEAAKSRYQSVFAQDEGAIAAPTASLHFTNALMAKIEAQTAPKIPITLHVGIGTFQPVKSKDISDHHMHTETYSISAESANRLNAVIEANSVVAVGTTVVRALESAFQHGTVQSGTRQTDIFIYPGIPIRTVSKLITNFHLPKSTLLMLVSAFANRDLILAAYDHAIRQKYRFFSYGDAMLIL